jgi:zinc protease
MIALLSLLLACAPKTGHLTARPAPIPEAGPAHEFSLPTFETRTLSNGLKVIVATQREVPLWDLRLLFRVGSFADPAGKEGLASVTLDMMNEGAGNLSAEDISRELKRLGSSIGTGADDDGASITASGLRRNLAPTLDLFARILLEPSFPSADWEVRRAQRVADLVASREDPNGIAGRVTPRVLYGDAYRGRLLSEASYAALTLEDMRSFHRGFLTPDHAILLVGGDITADEIVPLLEARLAGWKASGTPAVPPSVQLASTPKMFVVNKPGAAQSVVRAIGTAPDRVQPEYYSAVVANEAFGGAFTARVNMNLREEKGYTYGARCGISHRFGPSIWSCGASVQTQFTAPAILEMIKEYSEARSSRPLTDEEIGFYQRSLVLSFPGEFEQTSSILGEQAIAWQYGLPADWTERYLPGVRAVTPAGANTAFQKWVDPKQLTWIVVGDLAVIRPGLEQLGVPLIELDRNGQPVGQEK